MSLLVVLLSCMWGSLHAVAPMAQAGSAVAQTFRAGDLDKIEKVLSQWHSYLPKISQQVAEKERVVADAKRLHEDIRRRIEQVPQAQRQGMPGLQGEWQRRSDALKKEEGDLATLLAQKLAAQNKVAQLRLVLSQHGRLTAQQQVEESMVSAGHLRQNPLKEVIAQFSRDATQLGDPALALQLQIALRHEEAMNKVVAARHKHMTEWKAWREIVPSTSHDATQHRAKLHEALLKEAKLLLKKNNASDEAAKKVAYAMMDASLVDTDFQSKMIQHIAGRGASSNNYYRHLFLLVLGCADIGKDQFFQLPIRQLTKKGQLLSDQQCIQQIFAHMIVTYRTAYDAALHEMAAQIDDTFLLDYSIGQRPQVQDWLIKWLTEEYAPLTAEREKSTEEVQAYQKWQQRRAEKIEAAHTSAYEALNNNLGAIWQAMQSVHASIDVLRVSCDDLEYPGIGAPRDKLGAAASYSILTGVLARLAHQKMVNEVPVDVEHQVVQEAFAQEMVAQRAHDRVRNIPSIGSSEELKLSYQAKMFAMADKTINVLRGVSSTYNRAIVPFAQALKNSGINVLEGAGIYSITMRLYGELNAARWKLPVTLAPPEVLRKLNEQRIAAEEYLVSLGVSVNDVGNAYAKLLRELVIWKKPVNISFEKPQALYEQLGKIDGAAATATAYCTLYKILWLCIWRQLKTVVASKGQTEGVTGLTGSATPFTQSTLPIDRVPDEDAGQTDVELDELKDKINRIGEAAKGLPEQLAQMARAVGSHAAGVKKGALDFADRGDMNGLFQHITGILDETGALLPGINSVLGNVYEQSDATYTALHRKLEQQSQRLLATMKGLITFIYVLSQYSQNKIDGLKRILNDLVNSKVIRFATWASGITGIRSKIRKIISKEQSNEDKAVERRLEASRQQIGQAWQGQISPEKVKGPEEIGR